jgi:hypothetical protein
MKRGSWTLEASSGGTPSTQAEKTATSARKDVTSATDETDEMDEISNYE